MGFNMVIVIWVNGMLLLEVLIVDIELGFLDFWVFDDDVCDGVFVILCCEVLILFWFMIELFGFVVGNGYWVFIKYDDVFYVSCYLDIFSLYFNIMIND